MYCLKYTNKKDNSLHFCNIYYDKKTGSSIINNFKYNLNVAKLFLSNTFQNNFQLYLNKAKRKTKVYICIIKGKKNITEQKRKLDYKLN